MDPRRHLLLLGPRFARKLKVKSQTSKPHRAALALLMAALAAACSSSSGTDSPTTPSPTGPSPTEPSPVPTPTGPATVTGRVTSIHDGTPLSGLQVASGDTSVTTGADGMFTLQLSSSGLRRFDITGSDILARTFYSSETTVSTTVIRLAPETPFDPAYYRQLLRDGLEHPGALRELRRWTVPVNLYVRTVDEANQPMPPAQVAFARQIIAETIPVWTDGRVTVASIEQGPETRLGLLGWITVIWPNPIDQGVCGRSTIGGNRSFIALNYLVPGCNCGSAMRPSTIRHETGHAMGFWHTDRSDDLMSASGTSQCDLMPTARERFAAAIAYQRPFGNADPDADPPTPLAAIAPALAIP